MDSLDTLITQIQGLSGTSDDLGHLHGLLKQSEEVLGRQASRLHLALQHLDPAKHSLGFLYILEAHAAGNMMREQGESFLVTATNFISVCAADQIRLAPDKFNALCRRLKEQAIQLHTPIRAILPLNVAIHKFQPSSEYLTPLHAEFFLVCLLAKCYNAGLNILEEDIFEIDQKKTGLVPRDFLLYCYYGGMLYTGLKQFSKALELFQHAITAPATVLNAITVEAYKKYILVSLIHSGQVPPFPKYTPSVSQRNLKSCTQDYIDLANAFNSRNILELKQCVASHEDAFRTDSNLGLVKQVISSLYKRNIQRLTQTFLTLSLHDIARTVQLDSPKQAELHILQMIQDGEIFATINQKDGMVSFQEDPEQYKTQAMAQRLDSAIHHIMSLEKKLTSMDEQVSCDHAYLSKIGRDRSRYELEDFDLVPSRMYPNL